VGTGETSAATVTDRVDGSRVSTISDAEAAAIEARFVAAEESGLKAAYDAYGSLIFSYCQRRLGYDAGADATQEVFVAAWKSRERFDPSRGSLAGWLTGIARFKIIDSLRKSGRQPDPVDDEILSREPDSASAGGSIDEVGEQMLVAEALESLAPRARKAMELAFYTQLTHAEISESTGVPLGTVKSDIRRGLERLRRHMEGLDDFAGV
jgi:RNA polymerase sigma factor (sigma-70 family)